MNELTPEACAALEKRVAALEKQLAEPPTPGRFDWLKVVGISEDNEFTRSMLAEIEANSEAELRVAQEEIHE